MDCKQQLKQQTGGVTVLGAMARRQSGGAHIPIAWRCMNLRLLMPPGDQNKTQRAGKPSRPARPIIWKYICISPGGPQLMICSHNRSWAGLILSVLYLIRATTWQQNMAPWFSVAAISTSYPTIISGYLAHHHV